MAKMNLIDRAVAVVSPERGLRRAAARQSLEFINSGYGNYGASTTKKSMRGWQFAGGDAKSDIEERASGCYPVALCGGRSGRNNAGECN